jgi:hypothetical protein
MNEVMLDEIITKKIGQWAQRGVDDSFVKISFREAKKNKRPLRVKPKMSENISEYSISKQLSLF